MPQLGPRGCSNARGPRVARPIAAYNTADISASRSNRPSRPARQRVNRVCCLNPGSAGFGLRQPTELQRLIDSIPYRKLGIWSGVALALWPLHDFFGVSGMRRHHELACARLLHAPAARPTPRRRQHAPGCLTLDIGPCVVSLCCSWRLTRLGLRRSATQTSGRRIQPAPRRPPPLQIAMGTFIVSFIGHSFVASTIGSQPLRAIWPDHNAQRRVLVALFFTSIIASIT